MAREVCQRANAKALIEGSITELGNQYVIGIDAVNCRTGETIAQEQVTADGKEKVIAALGKATSELRSKLGESAASLQTYDQPLDKITTSSLDALQAYTAGTNAMVSGDPTAAIASLKHAIALDPNFAQAYANLGTAYTFVGQTGLSVENSAKAYELRDRASEREQFSITSNYEFFVAGNMEKTIDISQQWLKAFPRDYAAYYGIGGGDLGLGHLDGILAATLADIRINPNPSVFDYGGLASTYINLDASTKQSPLSRKPEHTILIPARFGQFCTRWHSFAGIRRKWSDRFQPPGSGRPPGLRILSDSIPPPIGARSPKPAIRTRKRWRRPDRTEEPTWRPATKRLSQSPRHWSATYPR